MCVSQARCEKIQRRLTWKYGSAGSRPVILPNPLTNAPAYPAVCAPREWPMMCTSAGSTV